MSSWYGGGLQRKYEQARDAAPTYPEVGASVGGPMPSGYDHVEARVRVGTADEFERAREALFAWAPQRHARVGVHPCDARPLAGTTVLLRRRVGPLWITAPCRVVWSVDLPERVGFAYGSLPGHPECGEESFVLDRGHAGTSLTIRAFSRPARWYARLGAPVTRLVQRHILARYLKSLQPSANTASGPARSGGNRH